MGDDKESRAVTVQIIVAIIGVIGVLGAAVVSNWKNIFHSNRGGANNSASSGGSAPGTQRPPVSADGGSPSRLRVTEALFSAEPNAYKGDCPIKIRFLGRISAVGGSGAVSYKFLRSDGALAPVKVLNFSQPGSLDVETDWLIGGSWHEGLRLAVDPNLRSPEYGVHSRVLQR
jgi:hypothetical protein